LGRWSRERIRYLRGGQAEALVAWMLKDELDDSWHVFNGLKLESESDIDHVVVGPQGVFCISTKAYRGLYQKQADGAWLRNNKPAPEVPDTLRQTMSIVDRLKALMGGNVPFVKPVLATPLAYVEGDHFTDKVWVVHQDNLTDYLAPEQNRATLTTNEVQRIVEVLEMVKRGAASVYRREQQRSD